MPTLYTGTTMPVSVSAGQTLIVKELTGTATVTGSSAAREDASVSIGAGFVVYGPQSADATLSMTTTGICEWQVVSGDATPAKTLQQSLTNVGVYGLIGGTVLGVGDSLVEQGHIPGNDNSTVALMLFGQACAELGAPFDKFANGGVSGENTQEILARVPALLALHNPTVVVFGPMSPNDYDDQFTSTQTLQYTAEMVRLAVNYPTVRLTFIQTTTPTDSQNMETAGGARGRKWHSEVRAGLRAIAAQYGGLVELVDTAGIVSAANASGMISGYAAADGTHFAYQGANAVNIKGFKPALARQKFEHQWKRPYSTGNFTNILGPMGSAPAGDNATGISGTVLLTGVLGQLPNGMTGRRFVGDTTATGTATSIANPYGYAAKSAQVAATLGADGGAVGVSIGRAASLLQNYDNPRANSTAYKFVDKIVISADLNGHVIAEGTSNATPPDFTGVVAGDWVADGTVTWQVVRRPKPGDVIEAVVDMGLTSLATAGGTTFAWMNLISSAGTSVDRYMNYAVSTAFAYPLAVDGARRMYRQRFTIPSTFDAVKTIQLGGFFGGRNTATANVQVHGLSVEIVS